MYCQVPPAALWVLHRVLPLLTSLVIKEDALGGLGSSGVAAVAILEHLVSLAVTLEQGADVAVLGQLGNLRWVSPGAVQWCCCYASAACTTQAAAL
jgi:hypothetical protein